MQFNVENYALVGIAVSLLVQWLKTKFKADEYGALVIVAIVSLVAASFYQFFGNTQWFEALANILAIAGACYAYIIKRFETK